jgi:hypothetical protein
MISIKATQLRLFSALFSALLITLNQVHAQDTLRYSIAEENCLLIKHTFPNTRIHFVSLHEDEVTCHQTLLRLLPNLDFCSFYQLKQFGHRNIQGTFSKKSFEFDPNRMFSEVGLKASLSSLNKRKYTSDIFNEINGFANSILKEITSVLENDYVVALHNNWNEKFSILSYINSADTDSIFVADTLEPDHFYLVTQLPDYQFFKSKNRNVVLQSPSAPDDGSLSIYCQKKNIPYINIEVEWGADSIQEVMILETYRYLSEKLKH